MLTSTPGQRRGRKTKAKARQLDACQRDADQRRRLALLHQGLDGEPERRLAKENNGGDANRGGNRQHHELVHRDRSADDMNDLVLVPVTALIGRE